MCRVPERYARELAHQIGLLGDQRSAAVNGDGSLCRTCPEPRCSRRAVKSSASSHVALRNPASVRIRDRSKPVRVAALHVALHALGAEHAVVERELFPRLEADDSVFANLQLDAALLPAEAAMGLHQLFRGMYGFILPAARRNVVQVRTVTGLSAPLR